MVCAISTEKSAYETACRNDYGWLDMTVNDPNAHHKAKVAHKKFQLGDEKPEYISDAMAVRGLQPFNLYTKRACVIND
jgi:hypothetical protein